MGVIDEYWIGAIREGTSETMIEKTRLRRDLFLR